MKYQTCEKCGANLDFGEKCDCETEAPTSGKAGRNQAKGDALRC